MYIISNLSNFEETSITLVQSPTLEIEKHLPAYHKTKELSIKENIAS